MTEYRAKQKGSPAWNCYDTCIIGISLGSRTTLEGGKLQSVLDWVYSKPNFKNVIVGLADTLQRHNQMWQQGCDLETATKLAQGMGDRWLFDNKDILGDTEVIRWDSFLSAPEFETTFQDICRLYETCAPFANDVHLDAQAFVARAERPDTDEIFQHSIDYLLEELAVFSIIGETLGPHAKLYPGKLIVSGVGLSEGRYNDGPSGMRSQYYVRMQLDRRGKNPNVKLSASLPPSPVA